VAVDDRKADPSSPMLLESGQHRLRVSSEAYRDESRGFAIEAGKTLELVVELQDATPVVVVEAPDSAAVTIDGVRVERADRARFEVEPGEHVAVCRIGDYTVTRRFAAARGKTYKLVLEVDLQVQEAQ
jgi:D-lyxose ketol-isomerase